VKDRNGNTLKSGQTCKVYPATRPDGSLSTARRPYLVKIRPSTFNKGELMTSAKHNARINEYLRERLEIVIKGYII